MNHLFASRMTSTHRSFLRELFKAANAPGIISFAGGLPNPAFFPVQEIAAAAAKIFKEDGANALQYSATEGYIPLRSTIAQRYRNRYGLDVGHEDILITSGSQQGLDLIGKVFLNKGDHVIIERPGYQGAIQALSLYEPTFHGVSLSADGIELDKFEHALSQNPIKLFYSVPNFQNPSGITYSLQKRQEVARLLKQHGAVLIEDDPYGELRFAGQDLAAISCYYEEGGILLGTFSKTVSPGMRLGWVCARPAIMEKLITAKQGSDLVSSFLGQRIVCQYLEDNDLDSHIVKIREQYKKQRDRMIALINEHFPADITYVNPDGGMFLWPTLPQGMTSTALFENAIKEKVAFVPGKAFYVDGGGHDTLRLSFSNSSLDMIDAGIKRLAVAITQTRRQAEAPVEVLQPT